MIHCCPTVPPPSSARIWARATFTMEMSSVIKKKPIEAIVITIRACGPLGRSPVAAATLCLPGPASGAGVDSARISGAVAAGADVLSGRMSLTWVRRADVVGAGFGWLGERGEAECTG